MILKLILFISCLSVTFGIAASQNNEPYSVEKVYMNSGGSTRSQPAPGSSGSPSTKPAWIQPTQKYHDDVFSSFGSFPSQVTEAAKEMKSSFEALLTRVIEFSNSASAILSSGGNGILDSFMGVRLDTHSADGIISEFIRVLHILMKAYRDIITNMETTIGNALVSAVNTAITNLESEFKQYVKEFEKGDGSGRIVEVSYESVMKRAQKLVDIVAQKDDAKLSDNQLKDPNVQDALVVLSLILDYTMILVYGLSSSSEVMILQQQCEPTVLHLVVATIGTFVKEITQSLVENTAPNAVNVLKHLENIRRFSSKMSIRLKVIFDTVEDINRVLSIINLSLLCPHSKTKN